MKRSKNFSPRTRVRVTCYLPWQRSPRIKPVLNFPQSCVCRAYRLTDAVTNFLLSLPRSFRDPRAEPSFTRDNSFFPSSDLERSRGFCLPKNVFVSRARESSLYPWTDLANQSDWKRTCKETQGTRGTLAFEDTCRILCQYPALVLFTRQRKLPSLRHFLVSCASASVFSREDAGISPRRSPLLGDFALGHLLHVGRDRREARRTVRRLHRSATLLSSVTHLELPDSTIVHFPPDRRTIHTLANWSLPRRDARVVHHLVQEEQNRVCPSRQTNIFRELAREEIQPTGFEMSSLLLRGLPRCCTLLAASSPV